MLQPVNWIPPEIISHIARYNAIGDTHWIVPLTHVCRYWRESIISTPENWTLITCYRPQLTALSLERSKAAPLQLWLDMFSVRQYPGFRGLITPYIHNIGTLQVEELIAIQDLTRTLPEFPQSTPNLRSLDLKRSQDGPGRGMPTDPFLPFPDTLRSLSLYNIPLYPSFLRLRTLTELSLNRCTVRPPLDTLLDFLEENRSLERVDLTIDPNEPPAPILEGRAVIMDRLRHLSITSSDVIIARTLISSIPLRRGAHLGITFRDDGTGLGLNGILSGISLAHLSNLPSPTSMEYRHSPVVRLTGPNGSFSYNHEWSPGTPFAEFPVLPLTDIRELHLAHSEPSIVFPPSYFPALETLTVQYGTDVSRLFSALIPNPSSLPSLKVLGFLDCFITEEFMEELSQFASGRKSTTSARLRRVAIVHRDGKFPPVASIHELEKHVPTVDAQSGRTLPADLT